MRNILNLPMSRRKLSTITFMDSPALLNMTLNLHAAELIDWSTFEQIKALLGKVELKFDLLKEQ